MAGALPPMTNGGGGDTMDTDAAIAMAMSATKDGGDMNIEIDEDLFDGEDLDALEDDLETLDLED